MKQPTPGQICLDPRPRSTHYDTLPLATSPLDSFQPSPQQIIQDAVPLLSGTFAFTAMLSLSTLFQLKVLRISTGTMPPVPTMLGMTSVVAASALSHVVSIKSYQILKENDYPYTNISIESIRKSCFDFTVTKENTAHLLRVGAIGLLAYKGLGGRFWSVAPSSITNLGSFAKTAFSMPATEKYATTAERQAIERLGRTFGCHTCGSRKVISKGPQGVRFIADHMPPLSIVKQMNGRWYRRMFGIQVKQRFYPQCFTCSNLQGGLLSKATRELMSTKKNSKSIIFKGKLPNLAEAGGGKNAYFHGKRLRLEHFAGGVVAAATTYDASERNVLGSSTWGVKSGNRKRFLSWERKVSDNLSDVKQSIKRYIKLN